MTRQQLINEIEESIKKIVDGYPSIYIDFTDENDIHWVIRVSDHNANPLRVDRYTISLVVRLGVNSNFRNLANQYFIEPDGCFTDNFESIEQFVNYVID